MMTDLEKLVAIYPPEIRIKDVSCDPPEAHCSEGRQSLNETLSNNFGERCYVAMSLGIQL